MIEQLVEQELHKSKSDVNRINEDKVIDCVAIFSQSDEEYENLNSELSANRLVDEMPTGNLYYLDTPIKTPYGDLFFVKIRKYDATKNGYRSYIDFTVKDYESYKNSLTNPVVKQYDNFEFIQFKNDHSIINIVSSSAKEDYGL